MSQEKKTSRKQRILDVLLVLGMRVFSFLPLAVAQWVGLIIGRIFRMVFVARRNINLCLPYWKQKEKETLVKQAISQAVMTGTEMPYIFMRNPETVLKHLKSERGVAKLRAALTEGRGVLMLGPHIGCWEMAIMYMGKHFPTSVLYTAPKIPKMDEIIYHGRTRSGIKMLPTNASGVKGLYQALANNEIVVMLTDQVPIDGRGATYVPFFDIDAKTMSFPTKLFKKYQPAVFSIYCARLGIGKGFEMRIDSMEGSFQKAQKLNKVEDVFAHACSLTYEKIILEQPEQYQWVYKRFKYQPDGVEDYYQNNKF